VEINRKPGETVLARWNNAPGFSFRTNKRRAETELYDVQKS